MGIASVAVYSECDRAARHVRMADEAVAIGPNPPAESYLRIDRIVDAARATGADAVHPGYGFLAENEDFAAACRDAGLTFIGPTPEAIALMGSKTAARQAADRRRACRSCRAPRSALGADVPDADDRGAGRADRLSGHGQGGRRRRRQGHARSSPAADDLRERDSRRAVGSGRGVRRFGRSTSSGGSCGRATSRCSCSPITHGTVLPFVERECSIQRRHQKVIEETPSPVVSPALRAQLTDGRGGRGGVGRLHQRRHDRVPRSTRTAASTSSR